MLSLCHRLLALPLCILFGMLGSPAAQSLAVAVAEWNGEHKVHLHQSADGQLTVVLHHMDEERAHAETEYLPEQEGTAFSSECPNDHVFLQHVGTGVEQCRTVSQRTLALHMPMVRSDLHEHLKFVQLLHERQCITALRTAPAHRPAQPLAGMGVNVLLI